jgi:benzylsuccinate CoA-transferase BbsF subunit
MGPTILDYTANGRIQRRDGNQNGAGCPTGIYPAQGVDRWVAISCRDEAEWRALVKVAAGESFGTDPRFRTLTDREENSTALDVLIGEWTVRFTARELVYRLQAAGTPAGMVQDQADLIVDPQLESREYFKVLPHARFGAELSLGYPVKMSASAPHVTRASPTLGQDNTYVLEGVLGLSPAERASLADSGVVYEAAEESLELRRPYLEWLPNFLRRPNWPGPLAKRGAK